MLIPGRGTLVTVAVVVATAAAPATALAGGRPSTCGKKSDTPGADKGGKSAGGGTGHRIR